MVCLGFEPGAAGWKARTNPLSYGGTPRIRCLLKKKRSTFSWDLNSLRHGAARWPPSSLDCIIVVKSLNSILSIFQLNTKQHFWENVLTVAWRNFRPLACTILFTFCENWHNKKPMKLWMIFTPNECNNGSPSKCNANLKHIEE